MPDQTSRTWGIVSNCWKHQLETGQALESLIDQAEQRGFRAIELRQGCLGEYESAAAEAHSSLSARDRLAGLSRPFPAIEFNLAVSLPVFGRFAAQDNPSVLNALQAAIALARDGAPHFRIVDTETRTRQLDDLAMDQAARAVCELTRELAAVGGRLSIEHAYQAWPVFWSTILKARTLAGTDAAQLRVCLDPCNLLLTEPPESVLPIVDAVAVDGISMIHAKQRRNGQIQPDVAGGDLDWHRLLRLFDEKQYTGLWLFEVAPHPDVWDHLDRSIQFLNE